MAEEEMVGEGGVPMAPCRRQKEDAYRYKVWGGVWAGVEVGGVGMGGKCVKKGRLSAYFRRGRILTVDTLEQSSAFGRLLHNSNLLHTSFSCIISKHTEANA